VAEEAEASVVVESNVAIMAVQHLAEQGRSKGQSARLIASKIQSVVENRWGTSKVPRFEDAEGGGWLMDVSPAFDDEAMYAVVRSKDGVRTVTHITEEEEAIRMAMPEAPPGSDGKSHLGEMPLATEVGLDPANPSGPSLGQQNVILTEQLREAVEVVEKLTPKADSPALVRVKEGEDKWQTFSVMYNTVGALVQELLSKGTTPDDIEVWISRRKPKVKVELE